MMYLGLGLGLSQRSIGAAVSAPINTVAPVITSPTTDVGDTGTVSSNGTWTNSPTSYTYQWQRDAVDIGAQTASTYLFDAADVGKSITCVVTAHNAGGTGAASSNAIIVTAAGIAGQLSTDFSLDGNIGLGVF